MLRSLTSYTVTVRPRVTTYSGNLTFAADTVEVMAFDRTDAIRQVRSARRSEDGRYGVSATFSARKTWSDAS